MAESRVYLIGFAGKGLTKRTVWAAQGFKGEAARCGFSKLGAITGVLAHCRPRILRCRIDKSEIWMSFVRTRPANMKWQTGWAGAGFSGGNACVAAAAGEPVGKVLLWTIASF